MTRNDWTAGLAVTYALFILSWFGLRLAWDDSLWWLALLNIFALYLFAPLLVLTPLAFWSRSRVLLAAWFVPATLFAILYGAQFVPKPQTAAADNGRMLKIMTFNVYGATTDTRPIIDVIRAESPDLVLLQELNLFHAAALDAGMAEYPYRALKPIEGTAGLGILSRYPFEDLGWAALGGRPDAAQRIVLEWQDRQVQVYNVHLQVTDPTLSPTEFPAHVETSVRMRERQADDLLVLLRLQSGPVVAAGDFNTTDTTRVYHKLQGELADAHLEAGWGLNLTYPAAPKMSRLLGSVLWTWLTTPNPEDVQAVPGGDALPGLPLLRLDYIWHSGEFSASEAFAAGWDGQSDHRPFVAVLHLHEN